MLHPGGMEVLFGETREYVGIFGLGVSRVSDRGHCKGVLLPIGVTSLLHVRREKALVDCG